MRNITVSVPDEVYKAAKVVAAENDTTVSAVVRRTLIDYASRSGNRKLAEFFAEYNRADRPAFSAAERLTREELYNTARRWAGEDDAIR